MPVTALPPGLVNRLRTGVVLKSIPQAVVELVANSIDADAHNITVTLNAGALTFSVEDDGQGLNVDDLNALGGRYSTSKIRSLGDLQNGVRTLGFRGEAISSLFEIADVRVVTRARGTFVTLSKQAAGAGQNTHAGPSAVQLAHSGTSVSVQKFLFNQPVKQRHMAVHHRDTEASTVQAVFRMALPFVDVTVTLVHGLTGQVLLHLPKGRDISATFLRLLPEQQSALPMFYAAGDAGYRASAVLGSIAAACPNQHLQYIYVNRRYVQSPPLASLLNDHFLRAYQRIGQQHPCGRRRYGTSIDVADATNAGITGGSCGSARVFPAFMVLLELPYGHYDVTSEPDKSDIVFKQLPAVQQLLRSLAEQAWGVSLRQERADIREASGSDLQQGGSGYREAEAAAGLAGGHSTARAGNALLARQTRFNHLIPQLDLSELQRPGPVMAATDRTETAKVQGVVHGLLRLQAVGHGGSLGQSKAMSLAVLVTPARHSPAAAAKFCKHSLANVDAEGLRPEGVSTELEAANGPGLAGKGTSISVDYPARRMHGVDGNAALQGRSTMDLNTQPFAGAARQWENAHERFVGAYASGEADTSDVRLYACQPKFGVQRSADGDATARFDCYTPESLHSPWTSTFETPGDESEAVSPTRLGNCGHLLGTWPSSLPDIETAGQGAGWAGTGNFSVGEQLPRHEPHYDYDISIDDSTFVLDPLADVNLRTGGMELTSRRLGLTPTCMPDATSSRRFASVNHILDGEDGHEAADIIASASPIAQMPMRPDLGMDFKVSTPSDSGGDVTWRCSERDMLISSPRWVSFGQADEVQAPLSPGDYKNEGSPQWSPCAAREWAIDGKTDVCGVTWLSDGEVRRVGVPVLAGAGSAQPSVERLQCGADDEEAFWAEGLSPETMDVVARMRLRQQPEPISVGAEGAGILGSLQAVTGGVRFKGDVRPVPRAESTIGGPFVDGTAEPSVPASNKARVPVLRMKGNGLGVFLSGLGDSPDKTTGRVGPNLRSRDVASERQYDLDEPGDLKDPAASCEYGTLKSTQQGGASEEAQGHLTRASKRDRESWLLPIDATVPRALADAAQERNAGQLDQPIIVGVAMSSGTGSREAALRGDEEGSLSPLAKFLSFANVSGDTTPTPPPSAASSMANTAVTAAGDASITRAAVPKHDIGGRHSGPRVSGSESPVAGGHKRRPTGPSGSLEMPSSMGSTETAPMVDACSSCTMRTAATRDKVVSPAAATAGTRLRSTWQVQSAPPHAKKRSRVSLLVRDSGLEPKSSVLGTGNQALAAIDGTSGTAATASVENSGLVAAVVDAHKWSKPAHAAVPGATEASGPQPLTSGAHSGAVVPPAGGDPGGASPDRAAAGCSLDEVVRPVCSFRGPRARAGLGSRQPALAQPKAAVDKVLQTQPKSGHVDGRPVAPTNAPTFVNMTRASGNDSGGTSSGTTSLQAMERAALSDVATFPGINAKEGITSIRGGVQMRNGQAVQQDPESASTPAAGTHTDAGYGVDSSKPCTPAVTNQPGLGSFVNGGIGVVSASAVISSILKKRSLSGASSAPKRVRFALPAEAAVAAAAVVADVPGIQTAEEAVLSSVHERGWVSGCPPGTPAMDGPNKQPRLPLGQSGQYAVNSAGSGAGKGTDNAASIKDAVPVLTKQLPAPDAATSAVGIAQPSLQQRPGTSQTLSSLTEAAKENTRASTQPHSAPAMHHTLILAQSLQPQKPVLGQGAPRLLSLEWDLLRLAAPGEHLVSAEVSRSCLVGPGVRVMQQVDCKFIPVMAAGGTLLVIDQHAAHERVRLEQLTDQLRTCAAAAAAAGPAGRSRHDCRSGHYLDRLNKGSSHVHVLGAGDNAEQVHSRSNGVPVVQPGAEELLEVQPLPAPVPLKLAPQEGTALIRYESVVTAWGWRLRPLHDTGSNLGGQSGGEELQQGLAFAAVNMGLMRQQHQQLQEQTAGLPLISGIEHERVLIGVPSVCGTPLTNPTDLRLYLQQLQEAGGADLPPPAVLRVLRSKACRTAVMFGDVLAPDMCSALLTQLHGTQLWTQCAHGRPTVAPLVHLPTLRAVLDRRRAVMHLGPATSNESADERRLSATRLQAIISRASTAHRKSPGGKQRVIAT